MPYNPNHSQLLFTSSADSLSVNLSVLADFLGGSVTVSVSKASYKIQTVALNILA